MRGKFAFICLISGVYLLGCDSSSTTDGGFDERDASESDGGGSCEICDEVCVDLQTDPEHCGECATSCSAGEHATAVCAGGVCSSECDAGFADCDGSDETGCETDLSSTEHCGACGVQCAAGPNSSASCDGSACGLDCTSGFADCDGSAGTGCEVPLGSIDDCGACDDACVAGANSTAVCTESSCGLTCSTGFADCDAMAATGCEADLSATTSCGSCDNACPTPANATPLCAGGSCEFTCLAGYRDCDGRADNGCEVNLADDVNNCGDCGHMCPMMGSTCTDGMCAIAMCEPDRADCNRVYEDGCEVETATDLNNCGGCGVMCSDAPSATGICDAGSCALRCDSNRLNCDANAANGCEVNRLSNATHCGVCGNSCDAGATCIDGFCRSPSTVFVTSTTTVPGRLGGLLAADAFCQARAMSAGLPGTYFAWMSTSGTSPSARFVRNPYGYRRVDGVIVANDWADLTDGSLDNPINVDENGNTVPDTHPGLSGTCSYSNVVTGTRHNGTSWAHCNDWTATAASGVAGESRQRGNRWTFGCAGGYFCANPMRIYCFQQIGLDD